MNMQAKRGRPKEIVSKRLWGKTTRAASGCLLWIGSKNRAGYGWIGINRKCRYTHRVAYALVNGGIPPGLLVLHKCDVPACVEPSHLFTGTARDNAMDAAKKGRLAKKLTEQQVVEILRSKKRGHELARQFGVNASLICRIRKRTRWQHVAAPPS